MMIRNETPADYAAIRALHEAAFAGHPHSVQNEGRIVDALRAAGALTISLVAEEEGRVAGHIAFSPAELSCVPEGCDQAGPWHLLGPVGVLPERQRRGLGSALVRAGLEALRAHGSRGCVLVGDPAFYARFGFAANLELGMPGIPPEVVLGLSFGPEPLSGEITHHEAFLTP